MSKSVSYLAVAAVAFLIGGFSFRLANLGGEEHHGTGQASMQGAAGGTSTSGARQFAIEGMSCQGCVDTITAALTKVPGVQSAQVSLADKRAVVVAKESDVPNEKIVAAVAAAGYQAQPASTTSTTVDRSDKQPILVNITRGKADLHAVSMALGLARSALKEGRQTTVFLNVEAPVFAAKDLGDDVKYADFPPVKAMLADFVAAGGHLLVCGHCAHVIKLDQANMIDGAKLVTQPELFAALAPGTAVFSY